MSNFEFDDLYVDKHCDCDKEKQECIITWKVYDQCRQQDCLTPALIGPARYAGVTGCTLDGEVQTNGAPIDPPDDAAAVTFVPGSVSVSDIIIVSKNPNAFKPGFFDVDLKIVITYKLRFFRADGSVINLVCPSGVVTPDVPAESIFNKSVTLFGSITTDITVATDFFNTVVQSAPFVFAEAKAVPLEAKLKFITPCPPSISPDTDVPPTPNSVAVTLGLFIIIKLFRPVQLLVESKGFCKPDPCPEISPNPCEFFNNLDFPFNIFNPPQKEDFNG